MSGSSDTGSEWDAFLAKLDVDGSRLWSKTFEIRGDDFGHDVAGKSHTSGWQPSKQNHIKLMPSSHRGRSFQQVSATSLLVRL